MASQNLFIKSRRPPEGSEYPQVGGPDIAVKYGVHAPGDWREPGRKHFQILILPDPRCEAELSWRTAHGGTNSRRIAGPHICTVGKQISLAVHWPRPGAFVLLLVSDNFIRRNGSHETMAGVSIEPESEYASGNIEVHHLDEYLAMLCHGAKAPSPDLVHGLGLAQASQIIARGQPSFAKRNPGLTFEQIEKADKHIEAHLHYPVFLRVKALARAAGVGMGQFARQFKAATGRTPHQHVMHKRIQRAQQLMAEGKLRKCDIAVECGFCDENHMGRCIRRICKNEKTAGSRNRNHTQAKSGSSKDRVFHAKGGKSS